MEMKVTRKGSTGLLAVIFVLTLTVSLTLFVCQGHAAIPQKINYQGYLASAAGVPVNGTVQMVFSIYDVDTEGVALWSETQNVTVARGVYNVNLGDVTPLNLPFDVQYYLGMTVGADPEMTPRIALSSTGYAFKALTVETIGSHTHSGVDITSGTIAESQIDLLIARGTEVTAAVEAHASMTENPHLTTAAQVGAVALDQANSITSSMIVVPIDLSGSVIGAGVISGNNSALAGVGLYGGSSDTFGNGVKGYASGINGTGVYGHASATGAQTNYGGYFEAAGDYGVGVHGETNSTSGVGVHGWASATGNATGRGGVFVASGNSGRGVEGSASATGNVTNYGGFFAADGNNGRGVRGYASATGNVANYGGDFTADGNNGAGVSGEATGTSGTGVYGHATGISGTGVYGEATGTSGVGVYGYGGLYDFYAAGPGANYAAFTGSHEVKLSEDFPSNIKPGMIVSVTGKAHVRKRDDGTIALSSTLPAAKLSKVANDKAVFGVFVKEAPLPKGHWYEKGQGERFATVNALGEGRVWVTNLNGNIEAGDYITTSNLEGYGQKQDDDILRSYTLGKSIETVDWDRVTETVEFNGKSFKIYLIAVVYTCG